MFASKYMRIISIIGIILLLSLQFIWLKNAYQMVERDIMEKSKECLKEAVEEELFERLDQKKISVSIEDKAKFKNSDEILRKGEFNKTSELIFGMQECMNYYGFYCSKSRVDTLFQKKIYSRLGVFPAYTLRIINATTRYKRIKEIKVSSLNNFFLTEVDSINLSDTRKRNDLILGNTIFIKLDSKRSIELVLTSPIASVVAKAKYIFIISILLVLLIGIILIFQFKSMMKDKEFTAFMKDYTRILAHEMRTPVNDIYMLTSRLMSSTFLEEDKKLIYQKESLNQCSKLLLGIDNILLVAKSEQARLLILKSHIEMKQFIEKIVDKYKNNSFLRKNVKIETHYDSEECMAYIDPELMENVVINLVENAIKYSKESVEIFISCSMEKNHIILRVKDNGFGISKMDLKHIFQIFERGKKVAGNQIKGFGIGLYYVQKVVDAHQGKVDVKSKEGVGSEFTISIPNKFQ